MPNKQSLSDIFNTIKHANETAPKKVLVGPGTYSVKCVGAEVKKSLKGKQMAALTFQVIDGECKGGTVKHYTMIDSYDAANPWKYATLVAVFDAYAVNLDSVCSVADSIEEAFSMATTKLAKKCESANPIVPITLTRKENGTSGDGKPIYRDYYTFAKMADIANAVPASASANAVPDKTDGDDFYKELNA